MKCHSDRKNVSSVIKQMSNLTEILFREDSSEGQMGTDFFILSMEDIDLWTSSKET